MKPTVVVVSHTHWDREWYRPFEVFRLRLGHMVEELLALLDGDARFRHFMLDGQTIAVDDVLELHPALAERLRAHVASGRISVGPWYVLQDQFLVGGEAIVRNLSVGLVRARELGGAMRIGYLPDAFGHIAQMPRVLRGFGIDTAVVWRGVGDRAPGSEWRWRALDGSEVLCLFLPGGYGNAHALGSDEKAAEERLARDLAVLAPLSRAGVILWMNGNDHQRAEPGVPSLLEALGRARPDVALEHASLSRAAELVRARADVTTLPVVAGELRRATDAAPVLSGVWSARSWQKRDHDTAQALLVRAVEPFVAFAGLERRDAIAQAWRTLLQCQPHDSICGCSVDEVHRDVDARLRRVTQLGRALVVEAAEALAGAQGSVTGDFALHEAVAILNPHPFATTASAEVSLQRRIEDGPFRLVAPTGELAYEVLERAPTDGPDRRPAEWLRLRIDASALPPHGVRVARIEPGTPSPPSPLPSQLVVREVPGGLEIVDGARTILHTFEDEDDRGDLYDFCPREGTPVRSSREHDLGVRLHARVVGRRVEIEAEIDNRAPDHRLRARFAVAAPPLWTDTPFGWIERREAGTHPISLVAVAGSFAVGGFGLHEIERASDGAVLLTLLRAVGWMSRGDLSTRPGHAGYNVQTPDGQGLGRQRFRYVVAVGEEAAREVEAGVLGAHAVALGPAAPLERALVSLEPASLRMSICKRADDGDGFVVRFIGPPEGEVTARLRWRGPIGSACASDLDERAGAALHSSGDELTIPVAANAIVTVRVH